MYNDAVSVKFQITLPDRLARDLKVAAHRQHIPLAAYIRRTMEAQLKKEAVCDTELDPFAWMTGRVDTGERDLAAKIDEILYGR
jgi:predicted nucleic acid-binding protein